MCIGLKQERGRVVYRERACVKEEGRAVIRASPHRAASASSGYFCVPEDYLPACLGTTTFGSHSKQRTPFLWNMGCSLCSLQKQEEQYKLLYEVCQVMLFLLPIARMSVHWLILVVSHGGCQNRVKEWTGNFNWFHQLDFFLTSIERFGILFCSMPSGRSLSICWNAQANQHTVECCSHGRLKKISQPVQLWLSSLNNFRVTWIMIDRLQGELSVYQ